MLGQRHERSAFLRHLLAKDTVACFINLNAAATHLSTVEDQDNLQKIRKNCLQ